MNIKDAPAIDAMRANDDGKNAAPIIDLCAANDTAKGEKNAAALGWVAGCIVMRHGRARLEPIANALRDTIRKSAKAAEYWRPLTRINETDKERAAALLASAVEEYGEGAFILGKSATALKSAGDKKLTEEANAKAAAAEERKSERKAAAARIKERDEDKKRAESAKSASAAIKDAIKAALGAGLEVVEIRAAIAEAMREADESAVK